MLKELLPVTGIPLKKGQSIGKNASLVQPLSCRSSCCWNCILLLATVAVLTMLVVLTKIALDQHNPHKHLPSFLVTSTDVDSFKISDNNLTAEWSMSFSVDNRDGTAGIYYDMLSATMFYEEKALAVSLVPPFYHRENSAANLTMSFAAESWLLGEETAGKMLKSLKNGLLEFSLQFLARIRFDDRDSEPSRITVSCDGVTLHRVPGSRSPVGSPSGPWSCKVQEEGLTFLLPFWLHF